LTHTSEGSPGERYRYNGTRFGHLDRILERVTTKRFAHLVSTQILDPLQLVNTGPNPQDETNCKLANRVPNLINIKLAMGYDAKGKKAIAYPQYFGTSAGMVSTVLDVAKFSIAYDLNMLLKAETREKSWTAHTNSLGEKLPYGLGWFIHEHDGKKIVWHYGWWQGNSSLIVKIPSEGATFVLLANSEMLSSPFGLGLDANVFKTKFAEAYLTNFVFRAP
jgi:CubicO group peptidase (beta-lactamase class C family)